jgi:hypothetical protein
MKKLYDDKYFKMNDKAVEINIEFEKAFKLILEKYFKMGYSPRELAAIAHSAIFMVEAETIMFYAHKEHKKWIKEKEALKELEKNFLKEK